MGLARRGHSCGSPRRAGPRHARQHRQRLGRLGRRPITSTLASSPRRQHGPPHSTVATEFANPPHHSPHRRRLITTTLASSPRHSRAPDRGERPAAKHQWEGGQVYLAQRAISDQGKYPAAEHHREGGRAIGAERVGLARRSGSIGARHAHTSALLGLTTGEGGLTGGARGDTEG